MNRVKAHALRKFIIVLSAVWMLTGCAQSGQGGGEAEKADSFTADTNTVILTRENGLIGYICEDFDESRYSFTDFEAMLNAEVEDYNAQMGVGGIEIRECTITDVRRFTLPANLTLVDAHDPNRTIALSELDKEQNYRVLITDDDSNIRIHGSTIYYIGEGDILVEDGEVATDSEASLHVIIY